MLRRTTRFLVCLLVASFSLGAVEAREVIGRGRRRGRSAARGSFAVARALSPARAKGGRDGGRGRDRLRHGYLWWPARFGGGNHRHFESRHDSDLHLHQHQCRLGRCAHRAFHQTHLHGAGERDRGRRTDSLDRRGSPADAEGEDGLLLVGSDSRRGAAQRPQPRHRRSLYQQGEGSENRRPGDSSERLAPDPQRAGCDRKNQRETGPGRGHRRVVARPGQDGGIERRRRAVRAERLRATRFLADRARSSLIVRRNSRRLPRVQDSRFRFGRESSPSSVLRSFFSDTILPGSPAGRWSGFSSSGSFSSWSKSCFSGIPRSSSESSGSC